MEGYNNTKQTSFDNGDTVVRQFTSTARKEEVGISSCHFHGQEALDIPSLDKKQDCGGPHALLLEDDKKKKVFRRA